MNSIYSTLRYTQETASWLLKPVTSCISERIKKTAQSLVSTGCYTLPEKALLSAPSILATSGIGMTAAAYYVAPAQAIPIGLFYATVWCATRNPPQVIKKEIHTLRLREKQADALKGLNFTDSDSDQALLLEVLKELEQLDWFENWMLSKKYLTPETAVKHFFEKILSQGICRGITEVAQKFSQEGRAEFSATALKEYLFQNRNLIFKKQIIHLVACDLKEMKLPFAKRALKEAEAMLTNSSDPQEEITSTTKTPLFPASVTSLLPARASGSVHLHEPKVPGLSGHVFSFYTTKDQIILCDPNSSEVGIISYPKTKIRLSTLLKEHIQSYYGGQYDSVCVRTWKMPKEESVLPLVKS